LESWRPCWRGAVINIWTLVYEGFDPEREGLREALCTLGNGYFATRGAAPESSASEVHYPGTYMAGVFNRLTTDLDSVAVENEDMVNLPNWLPLAFRTEGADWFDLHKAELLEYRQELDLRKGLLTRLVRFREPSGKETRFVQRRFVHMAFPHLAGLETTIVAENWSGRIDIRSALDGGVTNWGVGRYRQLNNNHLVPVDTTLVDSETICLRVETSQSHIRIGEAARTRVLRDGQLVEPQRRVVQEPGYIAQEFSVELQEGQAVTIEKIAALYTSRDHAISESGLEACKEVKRAAAFDGLLERHVLSWDHLWRGFCLAIRDDGRSAMVLNLHIFHLLQTASKNTIDLDVGVPPRGLHGEAYRGHILWDELFIFPFLNFRLPDLTRSLLMYRYRRLPEARWAARQASYSGAMFPWQSGSNGREESQTWHLNPRSGRWVPDNSQLQRHTNIAIAYNVWDYYQVTGDIEFLSYYGAEMIIEIARFWASKSEYNRALDRYEICKVMGPDEYHDADPDAEEPGLNNNSYTNVMAVWVLCRTLEMLELLPDYRRQNLWENLGLRREELERWDDISRKMRVIFHEDGIISQFEGYADLEEFDWEGYRQKYGNIQRLDRIMESEGDTPNRYKASKQADVLMLFYLLSSDELRELFDRLGYPFDCQTIPRNIQYYLSRTSHGSTLSRVVHSWVLARSQRQQSWEFFKEALESDITDIQGGTTSEGIHLGAMAGTVDLLQRGYTGIETRGGVLWFDPSLPPQLKSLQFNLWYHHHWINVQVTGEKLRVGIRPAESASIKIGFKEQVFELDPGATREFELHRGAAEES
jgi:alpha,alpha-trehalase